MVLLSLCFVSVVEKGRRFVEGEICITKEKEESDQPNLHLFQTPQQ